VEWAGIAVEKRQYTHNIVVTAQGAALPLPPSSPSSSFSSSSAASTSTSASLHRHHLLLLLGAAACKLCDRTAPSSSKFRRRRQRPCQLTLARHLDRTQRSFASVRHAPLERSPDVCVKQSVGPSCAHAAARLAGKQSVAAEGPRCPPHRRRHHELSVQQEAPRARGLG